MTANLFFCRSNLLCLITFCFIQIWSPVSAEVQTITHGKSLVISCEQALLALRSEQDTLSESRNDAFVCMAFLSGIIAATQHANEQAKLTYSLITQGKGNQAMFNIYCFDWLLSYEKVAEIVLSFARKNSEYLQMPAHKLVIRALQNAFPCR